MGKLQRIHSRSSPAGVTLLEVLIALILLVFGVLAVVRIYPTGLALIRHSSMRSVALRLAEERMEQWKNRSLSLPEFTLALDELGGWNPWADRDAQFETEAPAWQSTPVSDGYEQLESLLFRQILREGAMIPAHGIYPLAAGLPQPPDPNIPGSDIEVTTRYSRTPNNNPADLSLIDDQRHYAINYATGEVWFDNDLRQRRVFLFDYAYLDGNTGQRQWILGERHAVLQAPRGATEPSRIIRPLRAMSVPGSMIVPGSETVRRRFGPNSTAPFKFKALPDLGLLEFNPENAGLPVEISYRVLDWRILQEEKTVAQEGSDYVIYTTLPFIQNSQEDPDYQGLDGQGNLPDIQIVDLQDPRSSLGFDPDPAVTDYRAGRIVLTGNVSAGQRVRVFYRTLGQWAVQPMKAAARYYEDWRAPTFNPQAPDLTAYSPDQFDPRRYRYGLRGGALYLAFYPSERGQAVVVDYRYDDQPGDTVPPVAVEGEMHTIPTLVDPNIRMCLVRLNTPVVGGRWFDIDRVHGTSLKIRASWQEQQVIKYVDLDTYMTRP